jgi:ribonuclease J
LKSYPNIEIHAPLFASALIKSKLKSEGLNPFIHIYNAQSHLNFQDIDLVPIHVNHSIPDTFGVLITHRALSISAFYVSDFKIDDSSPYEKPFDFKKLNQSSKDFKKKILLCDSTNIYARNAKTSSEGDLIPALDRIISQSGRTFATFFSSNIHRLQTFINLAQKHDKKIVLYGGALKKYFQIALETGHLVVPDKVIIEAESVNPIKDNLLILASGCQADLRSTFRRIGVGEDKLFKLTSTDTVIISSKAIPGNERKLTQVLNKIAEAGAAIYLSDNHLIHASGHPGKKDLDLLLKAFNPNILIPIHGESYFLQHFSDFVTRDYPNISTIKLLNGVTYECDNDSLSETHVNEPLLIHGRMIEISKSRISERRKLATRGVVFISFLNNKKNRDLTFWST